MARLLIACVSGVIGLIFNFITVFINPNVSWVACGVFFAISLMLVISVVHDLYLRQWIKKQQAIARDNLTNW